MALDLQTPTFTSNLINQATTPTSTTPTQAPMGYVIIRNQRYPHYPYESMGASVIAIYHNLEAALAALEDYVGNMYVGMFKEAIPTPDGVKGWIKGYKLGLDKRIVDGEVILEKVPFMDGCGDK